MKRFFFLLAFFCLFVPAAYAATCTVDVGRITKTISEPIWGVHSASIFGGQTEVDTICNSTTGWRNISWDKDRAIGAGVKILRSDMDLNNVCLTLTAAPNYMCIFGTNTAVEYQNIEVHVNETKFIGDQGGIKIWTLESPVKQYSDNDTGCFQGAGFEWGNCGWNNFTKAGQITAQFAHRVGCNGTYTCMFAPENEPYGKSFLYPNETAPSSAEIACVKRVDYVGRSWTDWAAKLKADCPTCRLISPSFTTDSIYGGTCAERTARAFMGNVSTSHPNPPECIDFHIYSSSTTDPKELHQRLIDARDLAAEYGWENKMCLTEGAAHPDNDYYSNGRQARGVATTVFAFEKGMAELNYTFMTPYIWTIAGSSLNGYNDVSSVNTCNNKPFYHMVENRNSTPYTTWFYEAINHTKWVASGTAFVNTSTDDSNVSCVAALNGTGQVYVSIAALRAATTPITVQLRGAEINTTYTVTRNEALTPTDNDTVSMTTFTTFGTEVLQINITGYSGGGGGGSGNGTQPVLIGGNVILFGGRVVLG